MIVKEKNKWVLYSSNGKKKLGTHSTKKKAIAQEITIKYSESN